MTDTIIKPRPGGSKTGRLTHRSHSKCAGIRFQWIQRGIGPVLAVVATWKDGEGKPHHTSYSTQLHGLEAALDKAIHARTGFGAPMPNRDDLLLKLRAAFETKQGAA